MEREFRVILHIMLKIMIAIITFGWNLLVFIIAYCYMAYQKSKIKKINKKNRGLIEGSNENVSDLFTNGLETNSIISGGDNEMRAQLLDNAIQNAIGFPDNSIILLHAGDKSISVKYGFISNPRIVCIDASHPIYDPFYNRSDDEIISSISDSFPNKFTNEVIQYLKGMLSFIRVTGHNPTLRALKNCPHSQLISIVNKAINEGRIQSDIGDLIMQQLMTGFSCHPYIERYFNQLCHECSEILCDKDFSKCYDIKRAIAEKKVLIFDITSSVNSTLLNLIFSQIRDALRLTNSRVKIILDDIAISPKEQYVSDFLQIARSNLVISSSDFYSMLSGDDKIFNSVVGDSRMNLIMTHGNATSSEKWSKVIGSYEKLETGFNFGGHVHWGCTLAGLGKNLNVHKAMTPIVKSVEIQRMGHNEVYIMDTCNQHLIHTNFV